MVLLSSKNISVKGKNKRKLFPKYLGPFKITNMVGLNAAQLDLPTRWSIHDVFHVSLLRPYKGTCPDDKDTLYGSLRITGGTPDYTPKSIVDHRKSKSKGIQYLVQWVETPYANHAYLSPEDLPSEMIAKYWKDTINEAD
jgi:hypothetical protein